MDPNANPFEVVKANDLSDVEIADYWVEMPGGFEGLIKPTSPVAMFILGGKGSGKTHLMRYVSSKLQAQRASDGKLLTQARSDGYLGLYMRFGTLNSGRFSKKGISEDAWSEVFAYYMELWLGQLIVNAAKRLVLEANLPENLEKRLVRSASSLSSSTILAAAQSLEELSTTLRSLQHDADHAVGNSAISRRLDLQIHFAPGSFLFGFPELLFDLVPGLSGVRLVFLLDELENLDTSQQRYINTLVREQKSPCTFRIGARVYGVRTQKIRHGDEYNREGSEFEVLRLDDLFRRNSKGYEKFAKSLLCRRLEQAGVAQIDSCNLDDWFETVNESDRLLSAETEYIKFKYKPKLRPYLVELRAQLEEGFKRGHTPGVSEEGQIEQLIDSLRFEESPFLERVAVFLLYARWGKRESSKPNLLDTAAWIRGECEAFRGGASKGNAVHEKLRHFRSDILAQLRRETSRRQDYLGLPSFITMSGGLPRVLLTLLKHVYKWSVFQDEEPFTARPLSREAQQRGVLEASDWFFREARIPGLEGEPIRKGVQRICTLLRALRYSDKPSECSLSTFSVDFSEISEDTRDALIGAASWSMLLHSSSDHRTKNEGRIADKFQIAPMLAPRWELPIASRGALELNYHEANAIFSESLDVEFERVLSTREARMTAPAFGRAPQYGQTALPGFE